MTDLLSLAARVEQLTGPCRETDCLIFEMGHRLLTPERRGTIDGEATGEYFDLNGDVLPERAPRYTESLDAAMTLCPELKEIHRPLTIKLAVSESGNFFWATISNWKWGDLKSAGCKTWPIALTGVLLRARAALEGSHE